MAWALKGALQGPEGPSGFSATAIDYSFNGTTTAPPGGGQCRLNNATQTAATFLWASAESAPGNAVKVVLKTIAIGDLLYLQDKDSDARWQKYQVSSAVVDNGTYVEIAVLWQEGADPLPTGQRIFLLLQRPAASQTPWAQDINAAGFKLNNAGNIGIGASAHATYKLDVAGDANITGQYRVNGVNTAVAATNAQTGTSYTLVASDHNKIVTLSNAAAITLTVPAGLGAGFNVLIIQLGAGKVTVTASGVTVQQRQSFTKTAGQYAVASVLAYAANTFVLSGDLGA